MDYINIDIFTEGFVDFMMAFDLFFYFIINSIYLINIFHIQAIYLLKMRRQVLLQPYGKLTLKQLIGKGSYGQIYRAVATSIFNTNTNTTHDSYLNKSKSISQYGNYNSNRITKNTGNGTENQRGRQQKNNGMKVGHWNESDNDRGHGYGYGSHRQKIIRQKHGQQQSLTNLQQKQCKQQGQGQLNKQKQYAIKILSAQTSMSPTQTSQQACEQTLKSIEREIKILTLCSSHPRIVKCHSVEIVQEMIWIIMDYYQRGSLADVMARERRTFSQAEIRHIMRGILQGLEYLHCNGVIHRDIKAANVLVDQEGQVRVADFGVSSLVSYSHKHTRTGSPLWMSPELLANSKYSYKTDIWSLGITALELAEGVPPYSHQHPYRAIFSIQAHPPHSLSEPTKWSKQFNNFVSLCLTLDQKKRPSATELLKHAFLNNKNEGSVLRIQTVTVNNNNNNNNCNYNGEAAVQQFQETNININDNDKINNTEDEEQMMNNHGTTILHNISQNSNTNSMKNANTNKNRDSKTDTGAWYKNILPSLLYGQHKIEKQTQVQVQDKDQDLGQGQGQGLHGHQHQHQHSHYYQYQQNKQNQLILIEQQSCKTFRINTEHEQYCHDNRDSNSNSNSNNNSNSNSNRNSNKFYNSYGDDAQNNNGSNLPYCKQKDKEKDMDDLLESSKLMKFNNNNNKINKKYNNNNNINKPNDKLCDILNQKKQQKIDNNPKNANTTINFSINNDEGKQNMDETQIVQALYLQMEAEIKNVRAKYLRAIRQVEESSMLTFHGQLIKMQHHDNNNNSNSNNYNNSKNARQKNTWTKGDLSNNNINQKSITKLKKY